MGNEPGGQRVESVQAVVDVAFVVVDHRLRVLWPRGVTNWLFILAFAVAQRLSVYARARSVEFNK